MDDLRSKEIADEFSRYFEGEPRFFRAPGRVNLIGEHTDYNEGFVLPFAIDLETVAAGRPRPDREVHVMALDLNESYMFSLDAAVTGMCRGKWFDYVEGTIRSLDSELAVLTGLDLLITSTIPIGGGLSSSAALEISVGFAATALSGMEIDRKKLAFAAQTAEHEFVGTRSGLMDQFSSVFGKAENALLLDCRSLEIEHVPLAIPDSTIAVCNTKVKHSLASSGYNDRRAECEQSVQILQKTMPSIRSLRDLDLDTLSDVEKVLPEALFKRTRHVVSENVRTVTAARMFSEGDLAEAGRLMYESHFSLRDDYEVSCRELDFLVDAAAKHPGVFGARMTGGGFGGCTVNLLKRSEFESFRERIKASYSGEFGIDPDVFIVRASEGASELPVNPKFRSPTDETGSAM